MESCSDLFRGPDLPSGGVRGPPFKGSAGGKAQASRFKLSKWRLEQRVVISWKHPIWNSEDQDVLCQLYAGTDITNARQNSQP